MQSKVKDVASPIRLLIQLGDKIVSFCLNISCQISKKSKFNFKGMLFMEFGEMKAKMVSSKLPNFIWTAFCNILVAITGRAWVFGTKYAKCY